MAEDSGIDVPATRLIRVGGRPVLLLDRFDREYRPDGTVIRIPYMSAMTRLVSHDGTESSFAEIAETADTSSDRQQLFTRAVPLFDLDPESAASAVRKVLVVTARWREYARRSGIAEAEITAMEPAFDHEAAAQAKSWLSSTG
ncbi:hypothetical protein DUY81_07325 [Acidipropionibacterium acidipropionici]|uniref:HipA-like C-terminal domain-containing protein n=1 Tax=Acidipropionibacterium acidipropionici TaxID=1748 RepID=A0AAC8YE12_9ACTN|nr:HipA domain-containing protein [Acidipropionibacterium acidipropionici]AMS04844.1 hypothetical protein AXH35_04460 [Acidipropionibacterium acidipropionici]AOZ46328.1 hypothetical protein A8L58_05925 [Acidipropionibacterium acidipropionici]AZP37633.1 hypothetical protein DUY81_07325 [Acidipropionibacterium acidipropionici]